ncbi:MAG: phospho-N-acetylmuramoyl-pentapeptide-transferase [Candidatus Hydrogenedentes bacterium]|nr:phospho-N-acetylmuramoyl-pentapeptide-transferase [Candidatus Hydrogenedentota bacterium]
MLYYLAIVLKPHISAFNVFTYHTVRAGGAAFTAFLLCLIIGPALIRGLQRLKVGQYIRKEYVEDLHALHQGKSGTPTMGGTLILLATVFSLLLWGRLSNSLLGVALLVLCALGAVGFLDDYTKLRRKHNRGLSAKAKVIGQMVVGLCLGLYLLNDPITVGAREFGTGDVVNWSAFTDSLKRAASSETSEPDQIFWKALPGNVQEQVLVASTGNDLDVAVRAELIESINEVLKLRDIFGEKVWREANLNGEAHSLLANGVSGLKAREIVRLNRLVLETAFPDAIVRSARNVHTKLEVPGLKNVLIPLGGFYVVFVMLIIVASSNAVNLTDGLDGLAIGASVISLVAYTGIAYVVSRADWSQYLFLIYVPEASELTVFGAALLGAGLGFLWYNSHPAEVFMGDTGSLALGGAIGAMAILTKQELLLVLVGGLFVLEAGSVLLQVASFKLLGKRVFRMAPLHHHFELLGWSESKVTIRFWILAILFALMSLATLKLR